MSLPTQSDLAGLDYSTPSVQLAVNPQLGLAPNGTVDTLGLDYFGVTQGVLFAVGGGGAASAPPPRPGFFVAT